MSGPKSNQGLLRPGIALPFVLIGLIWGSTWLVLADQLRGASATWSVALRFAIAAPVMFAVAGVQRKRLLLNRREHLLALTVGMLQFTMNYNFVYQAGQHLTSGIVGLMSALLIVPNAVFGWLLLGERMTVRFCLGSLVAMTGVGLLMLHESHVAGPMGTVGLGVAFSVAAQLAASLSSVIQANDTGRAAPMASLVSWSMLYGALANTAIAWFESGAPDLPARLGYWIGLCYLAVVGSVVTFPIYFRLVREIGAGRTAYNGIIVLTVAMTLSTLFEGYRWSLLAGVGIALAVLGLIVALRARNPAR